MTDQLQGMQDLHIKEFARKVICDGHLYLMVGEKKYFMMKPGIMVEPAFIRKHGPLNTNFKFQSVVSLEIEDKFKLLFKELRYLQFEKDVRLKSFEIVNYFHKTFSEQNHFLNFAICCFEEFLQIPKEEIIKMHETDMHLFRKSLYSSAFAVIIAMMNDFYHYNILKDFYNITFGLDIGLCDLDYSYYVASACNEENNLPGSGLDYLKKEHATKEEVKVFLNHPQKSHELIGRLDILSYPDLLEIILYQHELSSGKGFPRGIHKEQISTWEAIVILADSLVKISDEYYFEDQVLKYFLNFESNKLADIPVARVYKKACKSLQYFDQLKETGT
ncbi:MAG: HD domain-containing phosphohydrolase [Bacteriovoracaceae bacterium]